MFFRKKNGKVFYIDKKDIFLCDICLASCAINAMELVDNSYKPSFVTHAVIDTEPGAYEDEEGNDLALCSECYAKKTNCSK